MNTEVDDKKSHELASIITLIAIALQDFDAEFAEYAAKKMSERANTKLSMSIIAPQAYGDTQYLLDTKRAAALKALHSYYTLLKEIDCLKAQLSNENARQDEINNWFKS